MFRPIFISKHFPSISIYAKTSTNQTNASGAKAEVEAENVHQGFIMNYENAYKLYLETIVCAMGRSATPAELVTKLTHLRQAISCYVCYNLLQEPHSSVGASCQHYVCRKCVGGKLRLPAGGRSTCAMCKHPESFQPDPHLPWLLSAYGSICRYIKSTARFQSGELNKIANGGRYNFQDIVNEGSQMTRCDPPVDAGLEELKLESDGALNSEAIFKTEPDSSGESQLGTFQPCSKRNVGSDYAGDQHSASGKSRENISTSSDLQPKKPRGRPKIGSSSLSHKYSHESSNCRLSTKHKHSFKEKGMAHIDDNSYEPISKRTRRSAPLTND